MYACGGQKTARFPLCALGIEIRMPRLNGRHPPLLIISLALLRVLKTEAQLHWLVGNPHPRDRPASAALSLHWDYRCALHGFLCGHWRSELRFSCLHSRCLSNGPFPQLGSYVSANTFFLKRQNLALLSRLVLNSRFSYLRLLTAWIIVMCHTPLHSLSPTVPD